MKTALVTMAVVLAFTATYFIFLIIYKELHGTGVFT